MIFNLDQDEKLAQIRGCVLTYGHFSTIHPGHIRYLKHAKSFDCSEKVYIDRSESPFEHCQIQNNLEIINYLESKGFKSYKTGELPFLNQVYLFNNAKQIVGAHGAAFANLVFCKKDTKIVEIKPTNRPNLVSRTISETQNLKFNLIETEVLPEDQKKDGDMTQHMVQ